MLQEIVKQILKDVLAEAIKPIIEKQNDVFVNKLSETMDKYNNTHTNNLIYDVLVKHEPIFRITVDDTDKNINFNVEKNIPENKPENKPENIQENKNTINTISGGGQFDKLIPKPTEIISSLNKKNEKPDLESLKDTLKDKISPEMLNKVDTNIIAKILEPIIKDKLIEILKPVFNEKTIIEVFNKEYEVLIQNQTDNLINKFNELMSQKMTEIFKNVSETEFQTQVLKYLESKCRTIKSRKNSIKGGLKTRKYKKNNK